ncbi:DUF6779 domain-containing protein [Rhodococcus zopfii]|uniref:DUF6779 domain-containing protein n=1 Tax=Rhodococcus zopfii TaxID=43772 RepID=UPI003528D062
MGTSGRDRNERRQWRSAGSMFVAALLALAMIASLFLIFSQSVQLLRVGVVVALWAATIGAIAMTKYRRESALEKAKVEDLKTVYELQLEREISARREYELTVEQKVRSQLKVEADEMAQLRADLAALRRNLEMLFDGRMPEDRTALSSVAKPVQEIGGRAASSQVSAPRPAGPAFASPDDEPLTAETTAVMPQQTESVRSATPGTNQGTETYQASPSGASHSGGSNDAPVDDDVVPDGPATGRRARRLRAEAGGDESGLQGRSVAEILASLSRER